MMFAFLKLVDLDKLNTLCDKLDLTKLAAVINHDPAIIADLLNNVQLPTSTPEPLSPTLEVEMRLSTLEPISPSLETKSWPSTPPPEPLECSSKFGLSISTINDAPIEHAIKHVRRSFLGVVPNAVKNVDFAVINHGHPCLRWSTNITISKDAMVKFAGAMLELDIKLILCRQPEIIKSLSSQSPSSMLPIKSPSITRQIVTYEDELYHSTGMKWRPLLVIVGRDYWILDCLDGLDVRLQCKEGRSFLWVSTRFQLTKEDVISALQKNPLADGVVFL